MPNEDVRAVHCPSCGASISMDGEKGICAYCGTVVERPPSAASVWAKERVRRPAAVAAPRRRAGGAAHGVLVLLIVLASVALVAVREAPDQIASLLGSASRIVPANPGTINEIAAALPRDGSGYDLLVYLLHSGDDRFSLALLDGGSHAVRWQSQPLSTQPSSARLVTGAGLAYIADGSRLLALRLSDGSPAWQTSLVAELPSGCDECLRLLDGRVVALQKDGSLQAFDAQSGRLGWSVRLAGTPRELPIAGDRLVTLEPAAGERGAVIDFLDPASGQVAQQIAPSCKRGAIPGEESPMVGSPLLFSPDGGAMYALFGLISSCAQRWNPASGERVWQQTLDHGIAPAIWYDNRPLLTDKALFGSNGGVLWALDTASGDLRKLADDQEYKFVPLAARDDTLIVLAWPSWDSKRQALWGLDAATGERRWQYALQAKEARLLQPFGDWDWRLTPKGLVVVQVLKDQRQLIVDLVDPHTGVSTARQTTALGSSGSPTFWHAIWTDDMAWLKIDFSLYAVDLATGATAYRLP